MLEGTAVAEQAQLWRGELQAHAVMTHHLGRKPVSAGIGSEQSLLVRMTHVRASLSSRDMPPHPAATQH